MNNFKEQNEADDEIRRAKKKEDNNTIKIDIYKIKKYTLRGLHYTDKHSTRIYQK